MSKVKPMPAGLVPGLGWLLQRTGVALGSDGAETENLEEAFVRLETELLELESTVLEEPPESPFQKLWAACDEVLNAVAVAWEKEEVPPLESARQWLAKAYQHLEQARQELYQQSLCVSM